MNLNDLTLGSSEKKELEELKRISFLLNGEFEEAIQPILERTLNVPLNNENYWKRLKKMISPREIAFKKEFESLTPRQIREEIMDMSKSEYFPQYLRTYYVLETKPLTNGRVMNRIDGKYLRNGKKEQFRNKGLNFSV